MKKIKKINVLHLFEMAAGPSIQTYFYKKFGYGESWVLSKNRKHSVVDYYEIIEKFPKIRDVIINALRRCDDSVDIVFIHGSEFAVPIFKIFTKKKVILQYHGSDINMKSRSKNPFRIICRSMSDAIIYNQKSHLKNIITIGHVKKEYHPNAVDTDLFKPSNVIKNGCVGLVSDNLNREDTLKTLKNFENITIIDKNENEISYENMPEFLNQYYTFIDYKKTNFGMELTALSRTALEALACGCKVYHNNQIIDELPNEHKPEIVIKKLYLLFDSILEGRD
jgi:hypothetical protein